MRRHLLALVLAALAVQGASPAAAQGAPARLARFDSCAELSAYARDAVRRTRGGLGVPTRVDNVPLRPLGLSLGEGQFANGVATPVSAPAAGRQDAAGESTTNVQEAGVDEPDLVKSDGRRLFALANGVLHAVSVTGDTPVLAGRLALDGIPAELLVRGDRVLVIGTTAAPVPSPGGPPGVAAEPSRLGSGGPLVQLTEVDVSDPARMRVARTLTVAGAYVSARLTGGTARVVLSTPPELPAAPAATAVPRAAVVPRSTLRSRLSGRTFRRALVGCRAVRHPVRFSGLDLLTVLTIDLDRGLFDVDRDAVMAGAQTVYASQRSLYVASQRWVPGVAGSPETAARLDTEVHRFDASRPGATAYAASGTVSGSVLNQFSLSEHDGALRVATTDTPPWVDGGQAGESESAVTVLRERDGRLEAAGRVGGLGRGERIYAVRFVGERGYVVTFRQVDPLYVVDLADPAAPRVAGELKIPGFSSYLHPVGDALLLGIGQDATDQGRVTGLQVSLFDVSDPQRPARLDSHSLGRATSEVEQDHHAFLWSARDELAVLPFQPSGPDGPTAGAVGLRVRRAGIAERGHVTHPGSVPQPVRRSLVAGERLVTVSDAGVATSRLDTLAPLGYVAFSPAS